MRKYAKSILKVRQPHFDGAGAQILRILSTFAISKHWDMDFCFDPLGAVDTQIFANQDELNLWNDFLINLLPDNLNIGQKRFKEVIHKNHRPWLLRKNIQTWGFFGKPRIHVIDSPQVIINRFPEYLLGLNFTKPIAKYKRVRSNIGLRVVVHIRQGELALSQYRERYLELKYFEGVLATIKPILDISQVPYEILICSEPNQNRLIPSDDPRIIESLHLDPQNSNIVRVNQEYFRVIQEMPSCKQTPILTQSNWIDNQSAYLDFLELINADVLVISKSSFSYLAGLLNPSALVISPEFWHPLLPSWTSMEDKSIVESKLKAKIKKYTNSLN